MMHRKIRLICPIWRSVMDTALYSTSFIDIRGRDLAIIAQFLIGYIVVIVTPGPNFIAIGGIAVLRGFWATTPMVLGISLGAACSASLFLATLGHSALDPFVQDVGRWIGAALLGLIALQILHGSFKPVTKQKASPVSVGATLCAGFVTGVTNPITNAYVIAQYLGPFQGLESTLAGPLAVALAVLLTVLRGYGIAAIFSLPAARTASLRYRRTIGIAVAASMAVMAVMMAQPIAGNASTTTENTASIPRSDE
jgi:threonine/homoserine/homoserine lactone efflux protein